MTSAHPGQFENQKALQDYADAHDLTYVWDGMWVFAKRSRLAQLAQPGTYELGGRGSHSGRFACHFPGSPADRGDFVFGYWLWVGAWSFFGGIVGAAIIYIRQLCASLRRCGSILAI